MEAKEAFEKFLDSCIVGEDSLLTNDKKLFTGSNIEECLNNISNTNAADEIDFKFNDNQKKIIAHALWFKVFADEHFADKYKALTENIGTPKQGRKSKEQPSWLKSDYKCVKGYGSGGTAWSGYKVVHGVVEPILTMWLTWKSESKNNKEEIKKRIVEQCKVKKVKRNEKSLDIPAPLCNILLYLCAPNTYEPIVTDSDKKKIVDVLYPLFLHSNNPNDEDTNDSLGKIKEAITNDYPILAKQQDGFTFFYKPAIACLWRDNCIEKNGLTVAQQLEYKKAMILYGPPGTGKTHDVNVLIDQIVTRFYLKGINQGKDFKKEINDYLSNSKTFWDVHVKWCQMHVNYSYDDFVIGQVFKSNEVIVQNGTLLNFIDGMDKGEDMPPYFVVLDEINRVDISRVFGEVFSAMEYRDKEIDMPYGQKLRIPKNLYFIGTMNEIDFSLEHIDFALRRRFVWVRKGFDKDTLNDIIEYKISKSTKKDELKINVDEYIDTCVKLNEEIIKEPSLGENYEIGHTFFAEIVPIYEKLLENNVNPKLYQAKQILWQISIKPTLEAYCGSMSTDARQNFIGEDAKGKEINNGGANCRKIFLGTKTENGETQS